MKKQLKRLFALLVGMLLIGSTLAATERFDYDPLGRLIRVISDTQTTEYVYDAAGNILEVKTGAAATPPSVSGITRSSSTMEMEGPSGPSRIWSACSPPWAVRAS